VSELLQLLTLTPYPLPMDMVRVQTFIVPEDATEDSYCPRCNLELPESAFYKNPKTGIRHAQCKQCAYKKSARYRQRKMKCA